MQAFLKGGKLSSGNASGEVKSRDKSKLDKASSSTKQTSKHVPWVEKYRPKNVDEVAFQDEVVAVLKKSLQSGDLPNLLFYGPPGTGKTSTILAAARELFGNDLFKTRVLELNASDERGIDVVRDKVKTFSQLSASAFKPDGKPCPPFKIVILDEADSMTKPAQAALRRTMEKESKTTRFCLICNYVSRIIAPITSRCAKFRFKPLAGDILEKRLQAICEAENVQYEPQTISALVQTSGGDLRKAITILQSSSRLKIAETVVEKDVYEVAGVIPEEEITKIFKMCQSDSYEKLEATVKVVMADGHSAAQFLTQFHDLIVPMADLSDKSKSAICEKIAITDHCLMDGADEYLQIMSLCTAVMQEICHGQK